MSESPALQQIGVPGQPFLIRITARDTMRYAAAVGDMNRLFFDDEQPDGPIIPPLFISSCSGWNLRQPNNGLTSYPKGSRHVIEYIEQCAPCHLSLTEPAILRIVPQLAAIVPKEGGCLAIYRYDVFIDSTDTLCYRDYRGEFLHGISVKAGGMPPLIPVYHAKTALRERAVRITPQQNYLYDAVVPSMPDICISVKAAHAAGFDQPILDNSCLLALCVKELVRHELHDQADKIVSIYAHFRAPVFPDSRVHLELLGRETNTHCEELHFRVHNADGAVILSHGYIKAVI